MLDLISILIKDDKIRREGVFAGDDGKKHLSKLLQEVDKDIDTIGIEQWQRQHQFERDESRCITDVRYSRKLDHFVLLVSRCYGEVNGLEISHCFDFYSLQIVGDVLKENSKGCAYSNARSYGFPRRNPLKKYYELLETKWFKYNTAGAVSLIDTGSKGNISLANSGSLSETEKQ
ncbi:MAG: hypothetical protein Q8R37_04300 [Nanoarchaeota archaeon]|nr:hypothetical protein [Nanoarchaeota archaeon]